MIFVNRSKIKAPLILTDPLKRGHLEQAAAIAHYSIPNQSTTYEGFKVYSHPDVKDALIELFKGKCAYCESRFLHAYSGDVEHFRPKAEVTEAVPSKPGYYWLASDWDNLLLSCRNCNQKLKHHLHGSNVKKTMGKMNQFPLSDESKRVRIHTKDYSAEEDYRLLLNPCKDDPEEHLEYDESNAVVKPKAINGVPSKLGMTSIDVYVLQRVYLVHARQRTLLEILAQIQRVKESVINLNLHIHDLNPGRRFYFEKILHRELARLKLFIDPSQEYVGMAKQVIGKFLDQFDVTILSSK